MPNHLREPFLSAPSVPSGVSRGAVIQFVIFALAGAIIVAGISLVLSDSTPMAMVAALGGYGVGVILTIGLLQRGFEHSALGACDIVTLARLVLAASLLAPLVHLAASPWAVLAIAVFALSLDGVDGWLARRWGHSSAFGARFDMEVDAALALILALNVWASGTAGVLVLVLGLPRYVFIAASIWQTWLLESLPESFARKTVCVLQIATLILLQLPNLSTGLAAILISITGAALLWSFGRDTLWLWRNRP